MRTAVALGLGQEQLDVELCCNSGQAFRWVRSGEEWVGIDGQRSFRLWSTDLGWVGESEPRTGDEEALSRYFRLDADLNAIRSRIAACDDRWEPILAGLPGLRLIRWSAPEECLISFLCTSANNIPRITGMIARLCEAYGEPLRGAGKMFPTVERLSLLEPEALYALGFGYRGRTVANVARSLVERGEGWLDSLREVGYWEAKRELTQLPGVGAKIADCVLLLGLDFAEAVPVDTHLWQAVAKIALPELRGASITEARYRMVVDFFHDRFGALSNWAHQYLFTAHLKGML